VSHQPSTATAIHNAAHEIVTVVAAGTTVAITAADAAALHNLATILDEYNNGKF